MKISFSKMGLRAKLLLFILPVCIVMYLAQIIWSSISLRNQEISNKKELLLLESQKTSLALQKKLSEKMAVVKSIVIMHDPNEKLTLEQRFNKYTSIYQKFIDADPEVYAYWDSWELSRFQEGYTENHGRMRTTLSRTENNMVFKNMDQDDGDYKTLKTNGLPSIEDPYLDTDSKIWMTSLIYPVKESGQFVGLIGIDLILDDLKTQVKQLNHIDKSSVYLISHLDKYIVHPADSFFGKEISENSIVAKVVDALNNASNKESYLFDDSKSIGCITLVHLPEVDYTWKLLITVPKELVYKQANSAFKQFLAVGIVSIILLALVIIFIANSITKPIHKLANYINASAGTSDLTEIRQLGKRNKELGRIAGSILDLNRKIKKIIAFAKELESGNLKAEYADSESGKDELGEVLTSLRNNLKIAHETEELRKKEDDQRSWENQKIAEFSALSRQSKNVEEISKIFVKNIVQAIEANQGCIYIKSNSGSDEPYLQITAVYAWERDKSLGSMKNKIYYHDGYIGECWANNQPVYLEKVPHDYVKISSGLGYALPSSILILPIRTDNQILGVIEIASFAKMEKSKDFVSKVCDIFASVVEGLKIAEEREELIKQLQAKG